MTRKFTFIAAAMAAMALSAFDINLETAGIAVCDPSNPNQARAAEELAKHLDLVSGRKPSTRLADFSNAVFAVGFPAPGKRSAGEFEALAAVDGGAWNCAVSYVNTLAARMNSFWRVMRRAKMSLEGLPWTCLIIASTYISAFPMCGVLCSGRINARSGGGEKCLGT